MRFLRGVPWGAVIYYRNMPCLYKRDQLEPARVVKTYRVHDPIYARKRPSLLRLDVRIEGNGQIITDVDPSCAKPLYSVRNHGITLFDAAGYSVGQRVRVINPLEFKALTGDERANSDIIAAVTDITDPKKTLLAVATTLILKGGHRAKYVLIELSGNDVVPYP